jgi:hypothetical protein
MGSKSTPLLVTRRYAMEKEVAESESAVKK